MKPLAVLLTAAVAATAAGPRVIRGDATIGGLRVGRSTPADARRALGPPTSTRTISPDTCIVRWPRLGLVATYLDLSGLPPCTSGVLVSAAVASRDAWRTDRGLRVGDGLPRLRALYRAATPRTSPAGWWLVTRRTCALGGNERYPGLLARVSSGRVSSLVVSTRACE